MILDIDAACEQSFEPDWSPLRAKLEQLRDAKNKAFFSSLEPSERITRYLRNSGHLRPGLGRPHFSAYCRKSKTATSACTARQVWPRPRSGRNGSIKTNPSLFQHPCFDADMVHTQQVEPDKLTAVA